MWPFKKKHPPLSELPEEGSWRVSQGKYNGRPLFLRINTAVDPFRGHPELSYQVGVAIPFKTPDENGLPQAGEVEELHRIEDRLFDTLEVATRSVVVAVITTNGMREFVLYAHDPKEIRRKYQQLKAGTDSQHEVQLIIREDPDWDTFAQFL